MLELKEKMRNINLPAEHPILRECAPLYEYAWFIGRVRRWGREGMGRDETVRF